MEFIKGREGNSKSKPGRELKIKSRDYNTQKHLN